MIIGDIDQESGVRLADSYGDEGQFERVDVCDQSSIDDFAEAVGQKCTSVRHLVSLAGAALPGEFEEGLGLGAQTIKDSIALNLTSHILLTQALQPLLGEGSSVVVVSSINAVKDYRLPAYSSAKAGLLGFIRSCATELGEKQVRINAVLPGTVATPRTLSQPKNFETLRQGTALGRLATPEEIAQVVYALCELMTCVTGQTIIADCGQVVKGDL